MRQSVAAAIVVAVIAIVMSYLYLGMLNQYGRYLISGVGLVGAGLCRYAWRFVYSTPIAGDITTQKDDKVTSNISRLTPKKQRPTHFVAIQVMNPKIHSKISGVLEHVKAEKPEYEKLFISLPTLHITLMVFVMDTETNWRSQSMAVGILSDVAEKLKADPLLMTFSGLGHFSNKVVFAKMAADEHKTRLTELAGEVRRGFASAGLSHSEGEEAFQPHLTIMKMSKANPRHLKEHNIRKISPAVYADHVDAEFGTQQIQSLQICAMQRDVTTGYYVIEEEVVCS